MQVKLRSAFERPFAGYALAVVAVIASFLLRYALVQGLGLEMPTYITFYPAVIIVAILAGFWPGVLATVLIVLERIICFCRHSEVSESLVSPIWWLWLSLPPWVSSSACWPNNTGATNGPSRLTKQNGTCG
jgi:hypothetical protein